MENNQANTDEIWQIFAKVGQELHKNNPKPKVIYFLEEEEDERHSNYGQKEST